jgi:D-alanine-D-alanine ligase
MTRRGLNIAVLYDVWEEFEDAAVAAEPLSAGTKRLRKKIIKETKEKKEKEDREEISEALVQLGHRPFYHVLDGTLRSLHSLGECKADLIFNLTESFAGDDTKETNIAAYLDLLDIPYTGGGPHAHFLAQDKGLAKKMFAFHGIRTPYFATSYRGRVEHADNIAFPLIVKPMSEDGSIGINSDAVVHSVKELMERIEYIQNSFNSPALIEEYIEGREIYAAILGSYEHAYALPLVELDLSRIPKGIPRIATYDVKFEKHTQVHKLTKSEVAENLDEEKVALLVDTALAAYRAVKLRDYGRIDMRLSVKGEVYVIEANPNPWLSGNHEFAMAAKKAGRSYTDLIGEIVDLAMARSPRSGARAQYQGA